MENSVEISVVAAVQKHKNMVQYFFELKNIELCCGLRVGVLDLC